MDRSASTLHKAFALLLLFNLNSIHFVLIVRFFSVLVFFCKCKQKSLTLLTHNFILAALMPIIPVSHVEFM